MKYHWGKLSLTFLLLNNFLYGQTDSSLTSNEKLLETIFSDQEDEVGGTEYYNLLEYFTHNPININKAGLLELQLIPLMDPVAAKLIISHREKYGIFFSRPELYMVEGLSEGFVSDILNFVTVSENKLLTADTVSAKNEAGSGLNLSLRSRVISDLQRTKAYLNKKYPGSSLKQYNRMDINYGSDISAGILTEKDPGENTINDFTSFYLNIRNYYYLESLIIGDYNIEMGQGLLFWSPYPLSKGSGIPSSSMRKTRGITPYHSSQENKFFRGAALKTLYDNYSLLLFFSKNYFDAVIDSTGLITSVPIDGYHRTLNEISRKNTASEILGGGSLGFQIKDKLQLQLSGSSSFFSRPLSDAGREGARFHFFSLSYDYYPGNLNFSGEAAYNGSAAAFINNIYIPVSRSFRIINSLRLYPQSFHSLHGSAFSENNNSVSNETGFYSGLSYRKTPLQVNIFFDQFKFPSGTYSTPFPLQGYEWNFDARIKVKPMEIYLIYRNSDKEGKDLEGLISNKLVSRYKIELSVSHSSGIKYKTAFAYKKSKENKDISEGYMVMQDLQFNHKNKLYLYGRLNYFITDNYESALYQYENDLPGIFRNNILYGEGLRWHSMIKYLIIKGILISIKYSETFKPKEKFLSSGDSEIQGNSDREIGLQVDIKF